MKLNMKTLKTLVNFRISNVFVGIICTIVIAIPVTVKAKTITVSTIAALKTEINKSVNGDIFILANGEYLNTSLTISKSNITIKAATPGGVFLNGTNDINIDGDFITFSGFQFTTGDIGLNTIIEVNGDNNVLTQLNFSEYYAQKYIRIKDGSQYNQITYCNLEKKPALAAIGCTIQISTSSRTPGYHKIRYCSFKDYFGMGGDNGNEPIRIGLGAEYLNVSRTIVEYCYFNNTGLGDSETISIKCQENVVRFCTFTNQQNAMLVFRNGDNNVAYSNFFINAGGIRVKEANNIFCYNNYFENANDAVTYIYVAPLDPPTAISPRTSNLNNINFINNTFYNCGDIDLGGLGPVNNTWANNIFFKNSGTIFSNANAGTTWLGNIRQGSLGITIASGMTNNNPLLVTNADGYRGLSASSPAINASSSNYPSILDIATLNDDPGLLFDGGGKPRPTAITLKDVGSDEFTSEATTNHPLTVAEVGPSYLGGPSLSVDAKEIIGTHSAIMIFPNIAKNEITIKTSAAIGNLLSVSVYNLIGQKVKMDTYFQNQDGCNRYDVSDLNNGIYFVKVTSKEFSKTMKLIIQK